MSDSSPAVTTRTSFPVLSALSVCHLLNDMVQSLLPAIYPILKIALGLSFGHIGLITLVNQLTASLLQPVVGFHTDRRPQPQSLAIGVGWWLVVLVMSSFAVIGGLGLIRTALRVGASAERRGLVQDMTTQVGT